MGDMADDAFNQWLGDQGFEGWHKPRSFQAGSGNYMWRQKDGTLIDMHDMSNDHIANAIKKCEQYNNSGKKAQLEQVLRDRFI